MFYYKTFVVFIFKRRNEATRTPDPYVPNVVRYQLRYIPSLIIHWKQKIIQSVKSVRYFTINQFASSVLPCKNRAIELNIKFI